MNETQQFPAGKRRKINNGLLTEWHPAMGSEKKPFLPFHYTNWLLSILIMAYYNPYNGRVGESTSDMNHEIPVKNVGIPNIHGKDG